jgi:hypothetical protein
VTGRRLSERTGWGKVPVRGAKDEKG